VFFYQKENGFPVLQVNNACWRTRKKLLVDWQRVHLKQFFLVSKEHYTYFLENYHLLGLELAEKPRLRGRLHQLGLPG